MENLIDAKALLSKLDRLWAREQGLPTGLPALDRAISGLCRGELIIVAGRPGTGKSSLLGNIALQTSEKVPTVIFTMEMSSRVFVGRMFASMLEISTRELCECAEDSKFVEDAKKKWGNRTVLIDDSSFLTIQSLHDRLETLRDLYPIGCVCVDYLQLMAAIRTESRQQEVADISRELKGLARAYNIPFVVASQLNRASKYRSSDRPRLDDLRESGAIEQDADKVLMIYRPEYAEQSLDQQEGVDVEIIIAKNRHGPAGTIDALFLGRYLKFIEREE